MISHFELSDAEFEQQFESCTIDPAVFTHEAHLRLAWIHTRNYGIEKAVENVCIQLLLFVDHVGARDKFNKTLTIAATRAVYHFMQRSDADSFAGFIHQFPGLKTNFRSIIAAHYRQDIFNSAQAKGEYIEPDIQPFS